MISETDHDTGMDSTPRRSRRAWLWTVGSVPLAAVGASWLLTPRLEPPVADPKPIGPANTELLEDAERKSEALVWPDSPLDGEPAKQLLLSVLMVARERLQAVNGYTAVLRRTERVKGKLGPEQRLEMKVRHNPFAVYFKFLVPEPGKEVIYAEGRYDNHVMAHPGGLARALVPRLKVPPTSALAMTGNRHPITEAGLLNLTERLIQFRQMDLEEADAETMLDQTTDDQGRTWLRCTHRHTLQKPGRPFAQVIVCLDPETRIPMRITSYDWPEPGHTGELNLAERYEYDALDLNAPLTDLDFDPANPAYDFKRG